MHLDELDLRVDWFTPAVPLNVAVSETWPQVRIVHVPSGLCVAKSGPRRRHALNLALAELESLVDEHYGLGST